MSVIKFDPPKDRLAAEAELLAEIHQAIGNYVGILSVVQVIGILDVCKDEVKESQ